MSNNGRILQPGQVNLEFEHVLPADFQPATVVNVRVGEKMMVVGGLTTREEIASRILAGMVATDDWKGRINDNEYVDEDLMIRKSLRLTDALLAKTRQQVEQADGV